MSIVRGYYLTIHHVVSRRGRTLGHEAADVQGDTLALYLRRHLCAAPSWHREEEVTQLRRHILAELQHNQVWRCDEGLSSLRA